MHGPAASESLHTLLSGPGETDLKDAEQGLTLKICFRRFF